MVIQYFLPKKINFTRNVLNVRLDADSTCGAIEQSCRLPWKMFSLLSHVSSEWWRLWVLLFFVDYSLTHSLLKNLKKHKDRNLVGLNIGESGDYSGMRRLLTGQSPTRRSSCYSVVMLAVYKHCPSCCTPQWVQRVLQTLLRTTI